MRMMMPILLSTEERKHLTGFPESVIVSDECEPQAIKNHSQSLQRLAVRGGLHPSELLAIVERRKWQPMTVVDMVRGFDAFG